MAFSASNSSQQSEINVTPLIDALLVLLIIFMVIVPVTPRGLDSRVPDNAKAATQTLGPVSLRLLGGGQGALLRYEVEGRVVEPGQLAEALFTNLRTRPERSVYVSASPELSYREIAAAVGAAKAAGATTVALGRL
jgi:biopolymer transport protein TolR